MTDEVKPLMPVAILAGGLATRLGRLTERTPKSLVEVAGEPFLAHQLRLLRRNGVGEVVLCVGHLGRMVRERFGDGAAYGVRIQYSFDGDRLRGTGGAIRHALGLLPERFFIMYGDSYLTCDYSKVQQHFECSSRPALMTVYQNDGRYDASNVELRDGRIIHYDKESRTSAMSHIDYGLGVFERSVFASIPADERIDLVAVYRDLLDKGLLEGYEVADRFYEIGSFEGLRETSDFLASESGGVGAL